MDTSLMQQYEKFQIASLERQARADHLTKTLRAVAEEDAKERLEQQVVESKLATDVKNWSRGTLCLVKVTETSSSFYSRPPFFKMRHDWTYYHILHFLEAHQAIFVTDTHVVDKLLVYALFPFQNIPHNKTDDLLASAVEGIVKLVNNTDFDMRFIRRKFEMRMMCGHILPTRRCQCLGACEFCSGFGRDSEFSLYSDKIHFGNLDILVKKPCDPEAETPNGKRQKSNDDDY